MPRKFLQLDAQRRTAAFEQAGTERGIHAGIIEKDFWVSWLLSALFSNGDFGPHLVFKGGTCLAKVFGAIERFSEDLDVSLSPRFVGFDVSDLDRLKSRTKREAAMLEMQRLCTERAENTVKPALEIAAQDLLGRKETGDPWITLDIEAQSQSPTLRFHYPTQTIGLDYIRRVVKLELGSLTDQEPTRRERVRPWIAETYPDLFSDWECEVTALELSRSFWEKATILHSEYYRPEDQVTPDRYARHYSDVARLLQRSDAETFINDAEKCVRVAEWKTRFFPRTSARYDLARHGSFRLAPLEARRAELASDYETMRPMFLTDPPPFEKVLEQLAAGEATINRKK